jgi:alpha/beta superfamily hydrolase
MEHITVAAGYRLYFKLDIKDTSSNQLLIFCHGSMCDNDSFFYPELLENIPVNTCRFDFSGCGRSEGIFAYDGFSREVADLQEIVQTMRFRGFSVMCTMGHSRGATVALMHSAEYGNIPLVILLAPKFDMQSDPKIYTSNKEHFDKDKFYDFHFKNRVFHITLEQIYRAKWCNIRSYCERTESKVFIFHGDKDRNIGLSEAYSFRDALGSKVHGFYVQHGAGHFFEGKIKMIADTIRDIWIQFCLTQL